MRRFTVALSAAALTALTAGCGGSATDNSGGSSWRSQVDAALSETNPESRARTLTKLGYQQSKAQDLTGSESTLATAAKSCEVIQDAIGRAGAYSLLAEAHAKIGNRSQAASSLDAARRATERIEQPESRVAALARIATIEGVHLKKTSAATTTLQATEQLAAKIADPEAKVIGELAIADAYGALDDQAKLKELLDHAFATSKSIADPFRRAAALADVGAMQRRLMESEVALATFDEAIAAAQAIPKDFSKAYALADLAQKLIDANETDKARMVLKEAEPLTKQIREPDLQKQAEEKVTKVQSSLPKS